MRPLQAHCQRGLGLLYGKTGQTEPARAALSAAIALYRRCGFAEEGRRVRQYRRASGELWDSIVMGLLL